jgi:predicted DNA-binding transcriptional regulator AlpA
MRKSENFTLDLDLDPNQIFRPKEAEKYFGYKRSQLNEKIKSGEIDPPIPLSDSGRAVGFTGRQIIEHHRRRLAAAAKKRGLA